MNHKNNENKNNKNIKIKEFFKKEGFYVVLFLCLCVVAVAATIATRNNKNDTALDEPKEFSLDITENQEDKSTSSQKDNAELVNDKKTEEKDTANKDNDEVAASASTTNKTETILHFPVEGTLARGFKEAYITDAKDEARISSSIHVKVAENVEVKAAGEGEVTEVVSNDSVRGAYVTIKHTDGRSTRYSNLDANILVKKGDKVTKDTVLGKVGSTSKVYANTPYAKDLEFELLAADGTQMNPTKIFKYTESN